MDEMMEVLQAIKSRGSVRAFLDKPVAKELVTELLEAAKWAPSGVNTQPWQVIVVQGETKAQIVASMNQAFEQGMPAQPDYRYYPETWTEPYKSRRFACGMALYEALGIQRDDKERRRDVWALNYHFFHAPVGLLFFIDKQLQQGSWLDYGMFLQNVMLAALGLGLATCPQAAMAEYPDRVREIVDMPADKTLICGMALGYADQQQAINQYRTERLAVADFTQWLD